MMQKEMRYQEENDYEDYMDYDGENEQIEQNEQENGTSRYEGRQLLLVFQIAACIIVICAVIILKFIGGSTYLTFKEWYQKELNNSVIASENLNVYQSVWNNVRSTQDNTQNQSSSGQK